MITAGGADRGPLSAQGFTVPGNVAPRFWANVRRGNPEACWPWTASTRTNGGYGTIAIPSVRRAPLAAHRVAYAITHGAVPAGLSVMHTCDNPPCCNPAHLRLGTHRENMRDAADKGRAPWQHKREYLVVCRECGRVARRQTHGPAPVLCGRPACRTASQQRSRRALRIEETARRVEAAASVLRGELPRDERDLVRRLGERDVEFLARNFGLYGRPAESLTQIGASVGLTRERVRQIVARATNRLIGEPLTRNGAVRAA